MQKIYSSDNRVLLYLLQSKLEEKKIKTLIKNEDLSGPAAGQIPPIMVIPELWIMEDKYYKEAIQIIEQELLREGASKSNWKCPECGEVIEGQFEVCWNCGHSNTQ